MESQLKVTSGTFSQHNPLLFEEYSGRQCSAMAAAAACYSSILNPNSWIPQTVNKCLIAGNALFKDSWITLNKTVNDSPYLRVDELLTTVKFAPETIVKFDIDTTKVFDGTSLKNEGTIVIQSVRSLVDNYTTKNYCIKDALIELFNAFRYGMFTCNFETIAVMKLDTNYYLFDSHMRDQRGMRSHEGKAILAQFENIPTLAKHIKDLHPCNNCITSNSTYCNYCQFSITAFTIKETHTNTQETTSNKLLKARMTKETKAALKNVKKLKKEYPMNNTKKVTKQELTAIPTKRELRPSKNLTKGNSQDSKRMKDLYQKNEDHRLNKLQQVKDKYNIVKTKKKEQLNKKYNTDTSFKNSQQNTMKDKYHNDLTYQEKTLQRASQPLTQDSKKRKATTALTKRNNKKIYGKSKIGLHERFREQKLHTPNIVCTCCAQLFFEKSTISENCKSLKFTTRMIKNMSLHEICCYRIHLLKDEIGRLCTTCYNSLKRNIIPKFASINGLVFEPLPNDLKNLQSLEERLISARIPFMQIRELGYQKQYGLKGNCINVPININKTVTQLPRMDSEDDTILVQLMRRMKDKNPYAYENVRPEIVFKAAIYLINTELYKKHNITLNDNWLQEFYRHQNLHITQEKNNVDDKIDEQVQLEMNEDEAIERQETLLTGGIVAETGIRMSPGENEKPISLLNDEDNDVLAFPTVYGGQQRNFKIKYTAVDIAKAEARHHDRRVATNIPKLMMNFCKARIHKLRSRVSINLRKKVKSDAVTASQILNEQNLTSILQHNDGYKIVATDRSSPAFWQTKQKQVIAMHRQFGSSSIFMTFSAAETKWNELIVCLYKLLNNKDISLEEANSLSTKEKMQLIKKDPITVARYIVYRFDAFRSLYHERNGPFYPYIVEHDFFRIEFQFRGSIHYHCMVWLKDCPTFVPEEPETYKDCEEFIDKLITCKKDETLGDLLNLQYHKCTHTCKKNVKGTNQCRFNYPLPPMKTTKILLPLPKDINKEEKLKAKELLRDIKAKTEQIAIQNEDCSFDEYLEQLEITEEMYIQAIRSNLKRPTVFLRRNLNERRINAYNREMLLLWEAHMDIQFIVTPYGCIKYVVTYVSKSQRGMSKLLKEVDNKVKRGDEDTSKKLFKIVNAFLNNCEISAQEIALHVLSIPMCKASIGHIYINTCPESERVFLKKGTKELQKICETDPNSTNIQETSVIEHYLQRPSTLETVCLADFVALFTYRKTKPNSKSTSIDEDEEEVNDFNEDEMVVNQDEENYEKKKIVYELQDKSGFLTGRNKRLVIQFRSYNQAEDKENFHRENLMLFTSWRTEPSLNDTNLEKNFEQNIETIRNNRSFYCKYDDTFNNINIDIEENDLSDDETESAQDFKIYELNNEQSDMGIEMPGTQQKLNMMTTNRFPIPNLLDEERYFTLITTLNEKQKRYLLNLAHIIKTKPNDAFYHFLSGGAGVGKSTLIQAIVQVLQRFWIHQVACSPDDVNILITAPTGKAAINIHGMTIDSAFSFPYNLSQIVKSGKILNSDKRNTLACKLMNLKLIIIDEISMCSYYKLEAVNNSLQEIFENNKPFGGISVITVGDFNQLPPTGGSYVFTPPKLDISTILGPYLWNLFKLYELTEIMRQKNDVKFAQALNNLAIGETTVEDDLLFTSRELQNLQLELTDLHDAKMLYYMNLDVDFYNDAFIHQSTNDKFLSRAIDTCTGTGSKNTSDYLLQEAQELHHKKTQNLHRMLKLCIDTNYIVSVNVAVPDGIANGSPCLLKKVIMGKTKQNEQIPIRAYVLFEDNKFGELTREKLKQTMRRDNITNNYWTPIERVSRSFSVTKSATQKVTRNQLPLLPSNAQTIHCSQSCTYEKIIVCADRLTRKLKYSSFSRVTSQDGLFIKGTYIRPEKPKPEDDDTGNEMKRMRNSSLLQFTLKFPEDTKSENNLILIAHNVRSLNKHFNDIALNISFTSSDIIFLAETWTLQKDWDNNRFHIPNFKVLLKTDCYTNNRKPFGTAIYIKNELYNDACVIYHSQETLLNHSTITVVKLMNNAFIQVYKSPRAPWHQLQKQLEKALEIAIDHNLTNQYIIGDFNIKYQDSDPNFKDLIEFITKHKLYFILNRNEVTTDHNSMIDLCFASDNNAKGNIFESFTSDHKPIWIELNK